MSIAELVADVCQQEALTEQLFALLDDELLTRATLDQWKREGGGPVKLLRIHRRVLKERLRALTEGA